MSVPASNLPLFRSTLAVATSLLVLGSCASEDASPNQGVITRGSNPLGTGAEGQPSSGGLEGAPGGENSGGALPGDPVDEGEVIGGLPTGDNAGAPVMECASTSQPTELQGVTLLFAFDVSASMASDDVAREFKWEPVALAAKTFFSSPESADVSAQLTFFPSASADTFTPTPAQMPGTDPATGGGMAGGGMAGGGMAGGGMAGGGFGGGGFGGAQPTGQAACTEADYATPDVPLTDLPSEAFGTAIDATEPNRLGTPTRWALPAVIQQAITLRETRPGNYAVVLVTDGLPTDCAPTNDDIQEVAALAAAGPAAGIPVYVIGVDTPDGVSIGQGEDGIGNLNSIAEQGGTEAAFIIDTGDVDKTVADFVSVVNTIKESTFSCDMPIPEAPPGQAFDATKVNVTFETDQQQDLVYDPSCATEWSWRYDDEQNPTSIVLCDLACSSVKSYTSTNGSVDVQFGCERRVINK